MIIRQVVTYIRHVAQCALLISDGVMYCLLVWQLGLYESALIHLSPQTAIASISMGFVLIWLLLQQQDFYANFYCLKSRVLYKRCMTAFAMVLFILVILSILLQHSLRSLSVFYSVFIVIGYLCISRLAVYLAMKPNKQLLVYTHNSQIDIHHLLQRQLGYVLGVVNPFLMPYTQRTLTLFNYDTDYNEMLAEYCIDEILLDEHAIGQLQGSLGKGALGDGAWREGFMGQGRIDIDFMEQALDKGISLKCINLKNGAVRMLSFTELFSLHDNPTTLKPQPTEKAVGIVLSSIEGAGSGVGVGASAEAAAVANTDIQRALEAKYQMHWLGLGGLGLAVDGEVEGDVEGQDYVGSASLFADARVFIINTGTTMIEPTSIQQTMQRIYSTLPLLPLATAQAVHIISCYPSNAEPSKKSILTAWLEEGIRGYCNSIPDLKTNVLRVGNTLNDMEKFTQSVFSHLGNKSNITLSHPNNGIAYSSQSHIQDGLTQLTQASALSGSKKGTHVSAQASSRPMDFYLDPDHHFTTYKIVEKVILAQGKYPRIHDGLTQQDNEVKVVFSAEGHFDPLTPSPYYADNVYGTHYSALLGVETRHIDRKTYSYLSGVIFNLLTADKLDEALAVMQSKEFVNGENEKVVSVGFRDVFKG